MYIDLRLTPAFPPAAAPSAGARNRPSRTASGRAASGCRCSSARSRTCGTCRLGRPGGNVPVAPRVGSPHVQPGTGRRRHLLHQHPGPKREARDMKHVHAGVEELILGLRRVYLASTRGCPCISPGWTRWPSGAAGLSLSQTSIWPEAVAVVLIHPRQANTGFIDTTSPGSGRGQAPSTQRHPDRPGVLTSVPVRSPGWWRRWRCERVTTERFSPSTDAS